MVSVMLSPGYDGYTARDTGDATEREAGPGSGGNDAIELCPGAVATSGLSTDVSRPMTATITVLYVDPDENRRLQVERRLERGDVTVTTAATPVVATAVIDDRPVDCVVSEYGLGDRTGLDLFEAVRAIEPTLPFVLCTAAGDERVASEAISAGVTDYVIREDGWKQRLERRLESWVETTGAEPGRSERTDASLRSIFEHSPDAIIVHDDDGVVLDANQRACDRLGYDYETLVGMTIHDVEVGIDPDELDELWTGYEYGEPITVEGRHRRADGSEFPVEINLGTIRLEDDERFLAIARDVTERKTRERRLERTNEQLRVLNRIVRHDIRNDMSVAIGWSEELEDHVDKEGEPMLERVQETSQHVVDLTRTVRDFLESLEDRGESASDERLECVDIHRVLTAELESRRAAYPEATFVVGGGRGGASEIPHVEVRADELLSSVFHNLLNNAVQHNDADEPRVDVGVDVDEDAVTVRIADDGPGIPPNRRDAIFGRTEAGLEHPAAGVGLYLVDTLVDRYDGDVRVEESELGGAAFVLELPR
ncbi:PAS domain S-box protein [Natrialbaceae archaeon AArc-T1-2]|uniref:PAS domain S-box protein n=1 Tax=Natrialbaceae archaeon AArc-T1-2 TaxID=3053904 RepID=UPI00255AB616|nr:PAS domain S-box protein [Natrialbaceae archaeon AArc-T1-2]WIV66619.1 PAS domain S-box protein [Natrialbaceae archaeon AArc-T1-2]